MAAKRKRIPRRASVPPVAYAAPPTVAANRNPWHIAICILALASAYIFGVDLTLWFIAITVIGWLLGRRFPWLKIGLLWFVEGMVDGLFGRRRR